MSGLVRAPEHVATVVIWQGHRLWRVAVRHAGRERDLIERFETPGAALDAAIKWAEDRGLRISMTGRTFEAYRPGVVGDDSDRAG